VPAKDAVRAALAALYLYSLDLKRYWDKNEPVEESEADAVLTLLAKRRQELFGGGSASCWGLIQTDPLPRRSPGLITDLGGAGRRGILTDPCRNDRRLRAGPITVLWFGAQFRWRC